MKGYVYILSNPAMPGLLKIGKTTRSVEGRAGELYQTGVPCPFVIEHWLTFPDCNTAEREVHEMLDACRIEAGREFFAVPLKRAKEALAEVHDYQVRELLDEFMPGYVPVWQPFEIDSGDITRIANELDAHISDIGQIIGDARGEDLLPAKARLEARRARNAQASAQIVRLDA